MTRSAAFGRIVLPGKAQTTLPPFFYGTAWKKDDTTQLVQQALQNGFTAIDTACQPRHYREDLVAEAIRRSRLPRSDIFIQTKYTSPGGHDANIPYDPKASIPDQVHQSLARSFKHFTFEGQQTYLDSVLMHSPLDTMDDTLAAWTTLESYTPDKIKYLGISNVTIHTLMELYGRATVKPMFVQNRLYADTKYDIAVRKLCQEKGMIYQSFWTLTANPRLAESKVVRELSQSLSVSRAQALYCLVLGLNVVVLNGTTNEGRMKEDLAAVQEVRDYIERDRDGWENMMKRFKEEIGEKQ